jgi:hypothetical protein
MTQSCNHPGEYGSLVSLLQDVGKKPREHNEEYLEAIETFLSHIEESPETMLDKVREAKTLRMRQELKETIFREALQYLDNLAGRDEVSMREYTFTSAVVGDLMRLFADNAMRADTHTSKATQ